MSYARFQKIDFHVHTPASQDVHGSLASATPHAIVEQALDAGLDAIVITDHNTVGWVERVRSTAEPTALTIFPGIEISTREGHLLAVFDPAEDIRRISDLLVRLGFDTADHGRVDALAQGGIDEVARAVVDHGGCAIAAHVGREKGFWSYTDANRQRRREIAQSPFIAALEVRHADEVDEYSSASEGRQHPMALVIGSDSWLPGGDRHVLEGIGAQATHVKMGEPSLRGLQQALSDPEMRIRLPGQEVLATEYCLLKVEVHSAFFDHEQFLLSPDVNCLLGGTGTGKSLAIEMIRYCLDQQPDPLGFPAIRKEVDDRLTFAFGGDGEVRVWLKKAAVTYVVERAMVAGQPTDPVVYRQDGDDLFALEGVDASEMFRIRAFSQSEVIEYARQPMTRLALLDGLLDLREIHAAEQDACASLADNAAAVIGARRRIKDAEQKLANIAALDERIGNLSKLFDEDDVKNNAAWEAERAYLNALRDRVVRSGLEHSPPPAATPPLPDRPADALHQEIILAAEQQVLKLESAIKTAREEAALAAQQVAGALGALQQQWNQEFESYNVALQHVLAEANVEGKGLASVRKQLNRLQEERAELSLVEVEVRDVMRPSLAALVDEREDLLDALTAARRQIREAREQKARELTTMMGGAVRIRVDSFRDFDDYTAALEDVRAGSGLQKALVKDIASACHPIPLVKSMMAGEYGEVAERAGVDVQAVEKLSSHACSDDGRLLELLHLQTVNVDDGVSIQFAVADETYRSIEALAHGQKCTAVLLVALAQGDEPLLVDQPEDALHAPWIEAYIVERLRAIRGSRQCIFATRSPNIVVSADSEQVITLDAQADRGWVVRDGSIETFENTELVVHHVEGGRVPFERRARKYAL